MKDKRLALLAKLEQMYRSEGPVVPRKAGPISLFYLLGPDAAKAALVDMPAVLTAEKPWDFLTKRLFPKGLLSERGDQHNRERHILHQAFKRPALRYFSERMNHVVDRLVSSWPRDSSTVFAAPLLQDLVLEMFSEVISGVESGARSRGQRHAHLLMATGGRLPSHRGGRAVSGLVARRLLHRSFLRQLREREGRAAPSVFRELAIELAKPETSLKERNAADHLVFMLIAAHHTTASALTSAVYELGARSSVQTELRNAARSRRRAQLAIDDLSEQSRLLWFVREILRIHPPLPIMRRYARDDCEVFGRQIPRGSIAVVSPLHTHFLPEWWDRPSAFEPERFSPERREHYRHPCSWIPFGAGLHRCLGSRLAEYAICATVYRLLLTFRWRTADRYEMPVHYSPIAEPRDGLPIFLTALS